MPLSALSFREAAGRFATGVTVVTTRAGETDHAMTANSFTSVSLDPLLLLVSVDKAARFHRAVLDAGIFGVSVLSGAQVEISRWFARRGRPLDARSAGFGHRSGTTGVVLFDGALATFECRVSATQDAGDHTIVIGEVVALDIEPGDAKPLVFYRGRYRTLS
jgi:flavin reductase (DIM6/NTAB) family NADH-FMN oxidoreductase RutF